MKSSEKSIFKSKSTWVVAAVVVALVVLGASAYALFQAMAPKETKQDGNQVTQLQIATNEELRLGLDELNKTLEQEKADRAATQKALDDQVKRVKLSN